MDTYDEIIINELNKLSAGLLAGSLLAGGIGGHKAGEAIGNATKPGTVKANYDVPKRPKYIPNTDPIPDFLPERPKPVEIHAETATIVAKTLYAEARGEGTDGLKAVATVIYNKAGGNPFKLADVCLKKYQFSCWNGKSDIPIADYKSYLKCYSIAEKMVSGEFEPYPFQNISPTNYCTIDMFRRDPPHWTRASHEKEIVGKHVFFELKPRK